MRRHDCAGAMAALAPLAPGSTLNPPSQRSGTAAAGALGVLGLAEITEINRREAAFASLLVGLYASSCGQVALAEERLFAGADPKGLLEDWRLYLLSDSARARGHLLLAKAALAKLLGDYPASPLRPRALLKAARLAWEQGDGPAALALIQQGRREGLRGEEATQLRVLAWEIGSRRGDAAVRGDAARELLIEDPTVAAQLNVAELFRQQTGELRWSGVLTAAQLKRRAQTLVALQLEPGALTTLEEVEPRDRDLEWNLLAADILSRSHRGREALSLLAPLAGEEPPASLRERRGTSRPRPVLQLLLPHPLLAHLAPQSFPPPQAAALEWGLAQAESEVVAAERGRSSITPSIKITRSTRAAVAARRSGRASSSRASQGSVRPLRPMHHASAKLSARNAASGRPRHSPERRAHLLAAQQHLRKVIEIGADPQLTIRALRALYADLVEEDLFDLSIPVLHKLKALDPADGSGAPRLWEHGWQQYSGGDYRSAIGTWTELVALYPNDSNGRRGRYWTARAFELLGEAERARAIYVEVASADTSDFYRRNALQRLAKRTGSAAAGVQAAAVPPIEPWPNDAVLDRARLLSDLGLDELAGAEIELVQRRTQPRSAAALQALILARRGDRRKSVLAIREAFPSLGGPFQATLPEEALKLYYPFDYAEAIRAAAAANGVPVSLVSAIIRQESAFDANAESWAGARGLMQLIPSTARELARGLGLVYSRDRLSEPAFNVAVGTSYLRQVLAMFGGNLELALAGYNGGPYRIKRLWRESGSGDLDRFLEGLSIEESKVYVKRILVLSDSYRRLYPPAG